VLRHGHAATKTPRKRQRFLARRSAFNIMAREERVSFIRLTATFDFSGEQ
jgi:hypothetical protein